MNAYEFDNEAARQVAIEALFELECASFYDNTSTTTLIEDIVIWVKQVGSEVYYWLIAEFGNGEDYLTNDFQDATRALAYAIN